MNWKDHFEKGRQLGGQKDYEGAAREFQRAIELAPDEPHPHYDLGYTLYHLGRIEEALDELRTTNRLAEGFFLVQTEIMIYEAVLDGTMPKPTGDLYRNLMTANDGPIDSEGKQQREKILNKVVRFLRKVLPDFPLTEYYFALYAADESMESRRASLERCLQLEPDDTTRILATQTLGGIIAKDDPEKALKLLVAVVKLLPDHPQNAMTKIMIRQLSN